LRGIDRSFDRLCRAVRQRPAAAGLRAGFVTVTQLDGALGYSGSGADPSLALSGGLGGLVKSLALEAKEFAQSVDRVSTISADKTRAVKLNLSKDKVTLSVVNPESGTATEDVGATYSAGALEIGFNARYLLDITSQIEGKEVRFLLSDAGSPAIIEDAEDARTLYVLMPLRV